MLVHVALLPLAWIALVLDLSSGTWGGTAACPAFLYLVAGIAVWNLSPGAAALWGAGLGLLADAASPGPLGIEFLLVGALSWLAARFRRHASLESTLAFTLLLILMTATLSACVAIAQTFLHHQAWDLRPIGLRATAQAAATGLLGCVCLLMARAMRFTARHGLPR